MKLHRAVLMLCRFSAGRVARAVFCEHGRKRAWNNVSKMTCPAHGYDVHASAVLPYSGKEGLGCELPGFPDA